MDKTPDELRSLAAEDRQRAEELHDDNPGYAGYLELRAAWRDYLARKEEEFNRGG